MTKQEKLKKSKLINLLKNNNNTNLDELLNNNNISTLILELLSLDEFIEYNLPLYRYSGDKIKITKNNIKNLFERGYFNDTDFFEKKSDKEQNIKMEILYYLYNEHKKTIEEYIQNSNNVSEDIKKIIYCLDEIKSNPNNVSKYLHNDSIVNKYYLNYAFENGLVLSNSNLNLASDCPIYTDYKFIKKSINYDYTNIIHANFDDRKMKRLLKIAKDNKFDFSYDNLSKFNKDCNAFSCEEFMKEAINYDCNNIIYSKRVTNSLIKYSIEKGFDFSYDNLEKLFDKSNNIFDNRIFMEKAIENDLDNICLYSGVFLSENIINKIIDNFDFSYENLSKIYEFNYNNYLFLSKEIMQKAIEFNNDNIKFCILHDYNFYKNEIIEKKLKISPEILQELGRILKESYMNLGEEKDLIEANPNNIIMIACSYRYEDDLKQYFEYAVDNGVDLSYEKLRFIPEFVFDSMDDNNVKKLIEKDVNNILLYKGSSDEVFKYAVEKGFKFTRENLLKLGENSKIFSIDAFKYAIEEDVNNILLYKGSSDEVFKYAVEKGFKFTRENLLKLGENSKIFSIDAFKYAIEEDVNNILLYKGSSDEVFKYAIEKGFILTYDNLNSLASKDILLNSEMLMDIAIKHDIKNLLEYNGNLLKFNFLKEKLKLSDNKNIEELIKKYEKKYNEYSDILTNYSGDRLKFLLNEETFNSFLEKIGFNKDTFIQYNFGVDYDFLTDIIQISKNSENLETFCSFINDMSKYYDDNVFDKSKMLITLLKNYNRYPELCENIEKNNIDLSDVQFSQLSKLFKNKIEINNINISKISDLEKIDEILMDKFQKNYDNSHDISEKIDNLCKIIFGYSNQEIEEMLQKYGNTARLKQLMFDNRYDEKIKSKIELYLGYTAAFEMLLNEKNIENLDYLFENIKKNSDVIFEINSLFEDYQEEMRKLYAYETNENLTKKDYIDDAYLETMIDKEKSEKYGVRDTSNTNGNSEYLCLREGLKPCCIILPNGREATDEEISIAKEYGLYFVKTQEKDVSLKSSPEEIKYKSKTTIEKEKYDEMSSKISQLQKLMSKKSPRKIAIFTDSHGLYEPTLEALEDARKDGVTEIYSLGDNIGTGSNPGEVIDLLEEYNVKSLKGNHEIYALDGIDSMSGHLSSYAMKEEAKKNSDWTKSKLTSEQIEEIRKCPEELEIEIGGKKVLLCHHTKDYNTGKEKYDTDKYDDVFQGHEHFESGNKNIHTVRAVGMGYSSYDPKGIASYIELVEKPDGNGYDIIKRTVNYSLERSKREIDESDAPSEDKEKISNWIR